MCVDWAREGSHPAADRDAALGGGTEGMLSQVEKRWHPDPEAPEVAIVECAQTMSGYLGEGVGRSVAGQR